MSSASPSAYDYDAIPIGYYDEIFRRAKGMQSKWHHLKFRRVRAEFPPKGEHLDVACGPGTFIGTLPPSIHSVGVDISALQIAFAQRQYASGNRRFQTMVPAQLAFPDASMDIVTSIELIEHISEAEAVALFRECHRVLKPGGKIVVTTPNYAFLWPLIERGLNRFGKVSYEDQHITRYAPTRLEALLAQSGFSHVKVETCLWSAPFAAALGWNFSDWVDRYEPAVFTRRLGHLLIGVGCQP